MGQNLKLKVLAEGVENLEQLEILKQSGCDYIQGFYFSKALPANEIQAFLKTNSMI
jgi:EAL domain-containing protein (putative c-di-GMP-specific phosphodiesterase class I)